MFKYRSWKLGMYSVTAFPKVCFLLGSGSKSLMASRITLCWRNWQISRPLWGASDAGSEGWGWNQSLHFPNFIVFTLWLCWVFIAVQAFSSCGVGACVLSCSVMSDSLWPYGLEPAWLLCPWDFPGKNTGVGCHFLLQHVHVLSTKIIFLFLDDEQQQRIWSCLEMMVPTSAVLLNLHSHFLFPLEGCM